MRRRRGSFAAEIALLLGAALLLHACGNESVQPFPEVTPTPAPRPSPTPTSPPDPRCGDGTRDPQEECDPGAGALGLGPNQCRPDCSEPWCGDGILDDGAFGEACDAGLDTGARTGLCSGDCTLRSECPGVQQVITLSCEPFRSYLIESDLAAPPVPLHNAGRNLSAALLTSVDCSDGSLDYVVQLDVIDCDPGARRCVDFALDSSVGQSSEAMTLWLLRGDAEAEGEACYADFAGELDEAGALVACDANFTNLDDKDFTVALGNGRYFILVNGERALGRFELELSVSTGCD